VRFANYGALMQFSKVALSAQEGSKSSSMSGLPGPQHAEMVAGPDTAYRAVEDAPAGGNVERGPVIATAHEDVVDTASGLERHLTVHQRVTERRDQWVSRCKRVAKLARVHALPGVPVADTRAA
jgi:hypothetical protein